VVDRREVRRVDRQGKATIFVPPEAFPKKPYALGDIDIDEQGTVYIVGKFDGAKGPVEIVRVDAKGKVRPASNNWPKSPAPYRLVMDGMSHMVIAVGASVLGMGRTGELQRYNVTTGAAANLTDELGFIGGLTWDKYGRLFFTADKGRVFVIPRPGNPPILHASGFKSPAKPCIDPTGKFLLVPDTEAGTITAIPTTIPGWEVNETPLPFQTAVTS